MIYRNDSTGYFSHTKCEKYSELFNGVFKQGDMVTINDCTRPWEIDGIKGASALIDAEWFNTFALSPVIDLSPQPTQDLHQPGAKDDTSKPLPQVVLGGFANALQGVTEIGTFGARKYTRDGWKSVPDAEDRYTGALLRHLLEHLAGRTIDEESGFTHLRHIAWNALALTELDEIKDAQNDE